MEAFKNVWAAADPLDFMFRQFPTLFPKNLLLADVAPKPDFEQMYQQQLDV